ncbi:MAG: hypothetical protein ACREB5_00945 [Sphingomonadaceae bacterium]
MNSGSDTEASSFGAALLAAADACEHAACATRDLDVRIALAVFPSLRDLPAVDEAVWRDPDGMRVRALHYSSSTVAASTLVPPGCWIEWDGDEVRILNGFCIGRSRHSVKSLALSAAALRARAGRRTPR